MNENILDDNLDHIDKAFVRTERIQKVETVAIIGSVLSLGLQVLNIILYGIFNSFFLGGLVAHIVVFAALIWWRKISMEFDANTTTTRMIEPSLLTGLRLVIPLYSGWVIFSSLFAIRFFLNYFSAGISISGMDWSIYIWRISLSILMAFLYIYYWRITKQSMDFINK